MVQYVVNLVANPFITIFNSQNGFPNLFNNYPQNHRDIVEIVVLMNRQDAIAKFIEHFNEDPFNFCDEDSITELDRERFFSVITVEEYAQSRSNYVIGL
jgi:hypothetical protein